MLVSAFWGLCIFCVRLLRVCSFNEDGHSRASNSGMGNRYGTHAFIYINNKFLMGCIRRFYYEKDNVSFVGHWLVRVVHRL